LYFQINTFSEQYAIVQRRKKWVCPNGKTMIGTKAPTFTRVNGNVSITGCKRLQNLGPFKRMVT
jgi:hypothetical protein